MLKAKAVCNFPVAHPSSLCRAMKELSFRDDVLPLKNKLYRLALRITLDTAEAEDVVQETLIRVWDKRESLAGIQSIEAFSMTICRNLALDRSECKVSKSESLDVLAMDAPDTAFTPFESLDREDRLQRMHRLFDALPEKQRTVMQLRDVEGHSYREIAGILGWSEEQVKIVLYRARQQLRAAYEKIDNNGL